MGQVHPPPIPVYVEVQPVVLVNAALRQPVTAVTQVGVDTWVQEVGEKCSKVLV